MPILRAENVFKTYRLGRVDVPVLHGVNLAIEKGEWVAILGASGSGKSTLLHLLGGLDRPDRPNAQRAAAPTHATPSRILYNDRSLADLSDRDLDRYRNTDVGFVFQFYHLLPELTIIDNVLIGSMIRHGLRGYLSRRPAAREHAKSLLRSFGLGHRLDHRPAQLSGGERQRVAIARALINDPPVLLADEPTGNLDRKTGRSILDAMVAHRTETGRTMVIVTHDLEVAQRADRIVYLEDGRIVLPPSPAPSSNSSPTSTHSEDAQASTGAAPSFFPPEKASPASPAV